MKKSEMKRITKQNLLRFVEMKKEYLKEPTEKKLKEINLFVEVINNDKHYFSKLKSYNFENDVLNYLMV